MKTFTWTILGLVFLTSNTACSVFGIRSEETPEYRVLKKQDNKEIRLYSPYIVAKTTVLTEDYKKAQSQAFRRLADYIFGKNEKQSEIKMTAPVTQSDSKEEKIEMTAPVSQAKVEGGWTMSFMMPSKYKMEDLPKPLDDRVQFARIPERKIAALRFTWLTDKEKNQNKASELRSWIQSQTKYVPVSDFRYAGYDPPWTIPFLRRQEVWIEVTPQD